MYRNILFVVIILFQFGLAWSQNWEDYECEFEVGEGIVTQPSQLNSNHIEPKEGSLAALLDGDFNTFFHSTWSKAEDGNYSYLEVDMGKQLKDVGIAYAKRNNNGDGTPIMLHVFATNNPSDTWAEQGNFYCTYDYSTNLGNNSAGKTLITLESSYRYVRLQVEQTQANKKGNGNLYFYWSEFRVFDPSQSSPTVSKDISKLVVTEIQTSNIDMFMGPTFNYDGWVEFYNPTDEDISMKGCSVSDDVENLTKYPIKGTTIIHAGGYGLIWLGNHEDNPTSQVQTHLDADGGVLYLSDRNGTLTHTIEYPKAMARTSWALKTDGTWGYTSRPTAGSENKMKGFASEMLDAPLVDLPSQLYQGKLKFEVSIPDGCTLRYTTDGSTPTYQNGTISQTGRFSISNTTHIFRFRLFKDDMIPSGVTTRSFIYTDRVYTVPCAFVVSDSLHFYGDSIGVMVKGKNGVSGRGQSEPCNWNRDWDRPVNFEYLLPNGESVINQEANLLIAGGWSRANEPHTFKIKANKIFYDQNTLDYTFFSAKPYLKHKVIQFRSGGNDNYCRFIDPALQTIIQSSGIDIDGLSYHPTVHYLNGKYNGVINLREPNNKDFVYANKGWDDDEIDQFEYSGGGYNQVRGTQDAVDEVLALAKQCSDETVYEEVCKRVDMDEFVNYMAAELYLGSSDWLNNNNNCKGYRHRSDDGQFRFVMLDTDSYNGIGNPFSTVQSTRTITNLTTHQNVEFFVINLFYYLCDNPTFRKKFTDTYCMVAGSIFEPSRVKHIVDSLVVNVKGMMAFEGKSPDGSANGIKNTMTATRQQTMIQNMKNYSRLQLSDAVSQNVSFQTDLYEAKLTLNGMDVPTNKFSGTLFFPITLNVSAPAGYRFTGWKKTIEERVKTVMKAGSKWLYYDSGSLDGEDWKSTDYDDFLWDEGSAPLGYANKDLGIKTTLSYGDNSSNKYPTYYLRNTVSLTEQGFKDIKLSYRCDDGFILYVNGKEALRYNMPEGEVNFNTYTPTYSGDWFEGESLLPKELFREGDNLLAIELHNCSASSTDVFWDASLSVTYQSAPSAEIVCEDEQFDLPEGVDMKVIACYEKIEEGESDEKNLPVRINEVSAANSIYVNEYFKRNDWIELYNTTDSVIDVAGMYLSDNINKPHKYQIPTYGVGEGPSTLIEPHGFMTVWCDKQVDSLQLHADFKLSSEDGIVMLTEKDDQWTDTLCYVGHDGNHTVGLYPDGGRNCYLLSRPTICMTNDMSSYSEFLYERRIPVVPSSIDEIRGQEQSDPYWYDLAGRRLDGVPTVHGIYIHGGRKVLIK